MHYRISFIFITFVCLCSFATTGFAQNANTDEDSKPVILYSGTPKKYEIADIKVEGVKNYEDYVLIGLSGLSVGQTITVPGDEITGAINVIGVMACSQMYKSQPRKLKVTKSG